MRLQEHCNRLLVPLQSEADCTVIALRLQCSCKLIAVLLGGHRRKALAKRGKTGRKAQARVGCKALQAPAFKAQKVNKYLFGWLDKIILLVLQKYVVPNAHWHYNAAIYANLSNKNTE